MNNTPIINDKPLLETSKEQPVHLLYWLWLVYPPLVTSFIATAWYLLAFAGIGAFGIIFYLFTPLICAVWSFRICRRLAGSSSLLMVCLFALELILILFAFLLGTPHWD
jgi:hypothetical protein